MDESVLSMVRCLYFVETFIRDGKDEFVFGAFLEKIHTQVVLSLSFLRVTLCRTAPATVSATLSLKVPSN